jgi:membrane-bound ClpP family serine protease
MPYAVALLSHPVGTYGFVLIAVIGVTYGLHTRRFLPGFTGTSAALLAALGFLHVRPSLASVALLVAGIALLHAEFRIATGGLAGVLGLAAAGGGSWGLLASEQFALPFTWRLAVVALGALALLVGIGRAIRRATLPR